MSLRQQLPVWSPLTGRAVMAAIRQVAAAKAVVDQVGALLRAEYGPESFRLTNSGTTALAAAMRIGARGAEPPLVALPAYGCYDLATAADTVDGRVVLYDLDPHTLGPDWGSFRGALSAGPSSAVVVHLYGLPVDMGEAGRLAAGAGTMLIEDAAQAVGATLGGQPCGSQAPLAVLSFGRGKGRTGGRGGALIANDLGLAEAVERFPLAPSGGRISDAAKVAAQWLLARPAVYGLLAATPRLGLGQTVYRQPGPMEGLPAVSAAVLARIWDLAIEETVVRREHAAAFGAALEAQRALAGIHPVPGARPGYLRFPVVAVGEGDSPFQSATARRLGIMPGYPRALADLEGFQRRVTNRDAGFPGARLLARRLGTLPTHSRLTRRDAKALVKWIAL